MLLLRQPAKLDAQGGRIFIEVFPTAQVRLELLALEQGKFLGSNKFSCKDSPRNWFCLDILTEGKLNGWSLRYAKSAPKAAYTRPENFWDVQDVMVEFMLRVRQGVNAAEMGLGKTRALFTTIDTLREEEMSEGALWWCAPKSALTSFVTQCSKWNWIPRKGDKVFNSHKLERIMEEATDWPRILVIDESTTFKIPSTRWTQLAIQLAIEMDKRWGDSCARYLLSGSPQPESEFDWYTQLEICRPGWIRESSYTAFQRRLANFDFIDKPGGGVYPQFSSWKEEERAKLPARLDGIVLPLFKKDWLKDLPEKVYECHQLTPTPSTLRVARFLAKTCDKAQLHQKLGQLSDGFQYTDEGVQIAETPKDDLLRDLLERFSWAKRFVVYAAYHASVDRVARIAAECGWKVWQYDGRGQLGGITEDRFAAHQGDTERICFVGNPDSAGKGLTLSASPVIFYYSNSPKGESRTQSEDRTQREGATVERGCIIIDCVHLGTDAKTIESVKAKRDCELNNLQEVLKLLGGDE